MKVNQGCTEVNTKEKSSNSLINIKLKKSLVKSFDSTTPKNDVEQFCLPKRECEYSMNGKKNKCYIRSSYSNSLQLNYFNEVHEEEKGEEKNNKIENKPKNQLNNEVFKLKLKKLEEYNPEEEISKYENPLDKTLDFTLNVVPEFCKVDLEGKFYKTKYRIIENKVKKNEIIKEVNKNNEENEQEPKCIIENLKLLQATEEIKELNISKNKTETNKIRQVRFAQTKKKKSNSLRKIKVELSDLESAFLNSEDSNLQKEMYRKYVKSLPKIQKITEKKYTSGMTLYSVEEKDDQECYSPPIKKTKKLKEKFNN